MNHPLTQQFGCRVLEIATEAKISKAYDAARMPGIPHPPYEPCKAVWDTGAMADTDMLIGMDIITLCDFAITNKNGKTTFSFDIPSTRITDYTIQ